MVDVEVVEVVVLVDVVEVVVLVVVVVVGQRPQKFGQYDLITSIEQ